jgi:hypothetical protein
VTERSVDPAEVGQLHQVESERLFGYQSGFLSVDFRQRRGDKRTRSCTLCVRDSQHNATEETSGTTFSQSGCRKGYARTSCKIRGNGGSAKESTRYGRHQR